MALHNGDVKMHYARVRYKVSASAKFTRAHFHHNLV